MKMTCIPRSTIDVDSTTGWVGHPDMLHFCYIATFAIVPTHHAPWKPYLRMHRLKYGQHVHDNIYMYSCICRCHAMYTCMYNVVIYGLQYSYIDVYHNYGCSLNFLTALSASSHLPCFTLNHNMCTCIHVHVYDYVIEFAFPCAGISVSISLSWVSSLLDCSRGSVHTCLSDLLLQCLCWTMPARMTSSLWVWDDTILYWWTSSLGLGRASKVHVQSKHMCSIHAYRLYF